MLSEAQSSSTIILFVFFFVTNAPLIRSANTSLRTILTAPPTILVATPGRLFDHLQSPLPPQYASYPSVASRFAALKTIIYDEADRLLDQGFKRELDAIVGYLPDKELVPRQAMMFSATVSKQIQEVCSYFLLNYFRSFCWLILLSSRFQVATEALKEDYHFVSTLRADEVNTHEHGMLPVKNPP